jgi:2',3'-cyclic-nucleotide 2'-phosphodiesterase (5'-nucleotidase family)
MGSQQRTKLLHRFPSPTAKRNSDPLTKAGCEVPGRQGYYVSDGDLVDDLPALSLSTNDLGTQHRYHPALCGEVTAAIMGLAMKLFAALLAVPVFAKQPSAPEAFAAPLRDLEFGQLNFLHTTDTHGWHAGHLLEPSFSADWGDYVDFATHLRRKLEAEGKDLLIVDTGDRIEGNGLYDASEPKGLFTFDIFRNQHMDIICSGNHELYKQNSSENEYLITAPAYEGSYLASNLDIRDPTTGELGPLAPRSKKFITKQQGIRIMSFGFLYNFDRNANNTVIQRVENTVKEDWFQRAIRDREIDLFVVIGHSAIRSEEFDTIFKAIRSVQWDTPIQFFGGHFHIRDYHRFDSKSYGLASGRFMETIGFQSITGLSTNTTRSTSAPTFFRRYIDNNLYSLYHHSSTNASTFHTDRGRNITEAISEARTALDLDETFGCAPRDLWMARAPYPSKDSIFSWLEEEVFPKIVNDTSRADRPRLVISNTGAIRFDIFKGAFTKDSTYIVCPFTSGFHFLKDVPYRRAKHLIQLLNRGGEIFENVDKSYAMWKLGPPEQILVRAERDLPFLAGHAGSDTQNLLSSSHLTPGYTTHDDAGSDGDDTVHSPIDFYRVPNCIQSTVNPHPSEVNLSEDEDVLVDVVYNEFIEPWILLGLKFLGLDYGEEDVAKYMPEENLTTLIAKWVSENWGHDC